MALTLIGPDEAAVRAGILGRYPPHARPRIAGAMAAAAEGHRKTSIANAFLQTLVDVLPHLPPDEGSTLGTAFAAAKDFATPPFPPEKGSVLNPDRALEQQQAAEQDAALAAQGFSPDAARWNRIVRKAPLKELAATAVATATGALEGVGEGIMAGGFQRAAAMQKQVVLNLKYGAIHGPLKAFESALKDQLTLRPGEEPADLPGLLAPRFPPEPGSPLGKVLRSIAPEPGSPLAPAWSSAKEAMLGALLWRAVRSGSLEHGSPLDKAWRSVRMALFEVQQQAVVGDAAETWGPW